jgi:hypothetical protein
VEFPYVAIEERTLHRISKITAGDESQRLATTAI